VRHFRKKHLEDRKCNFCDIQEDDILTRTHWQKHAQIVHRLKT
jgi:hypothetical protein